MFTKTFRKEGNPQVYVVPLTWFPRDPASSSALCSPLSPQLPKDPPGGQATGLPGGEDQGVSEVLACGQTERASGESPQGCHCPAKLYVPHWV